MNLPLMARLFCYAMAAAFLTGCGSMGMKPQAEELIRPWMGREALTSQTTSLDAAAKLWAVAPAAAQGWVGSENGPFYLSPGVRFRITGLEINPSPVSGPNIFIKVRSAALMSGQEIVLSARNWGLKPSVSCLLSSGRYQKTSDCFSRTIPIFIGCPPEKGGPVRRCV